MSFAIPHINNIYFSKLVQSHGVYAVVRALLMVKVLIAAVMLLCGREIPALLLLFVASNRIFTEVWSHKSACLCGERESERS
jgi:hypothetical protein